jgi:hypothetical protein
MKRILLALPCALLLFPPQANSAEMRTCHQTCAELLNHDSNCEKYCTEKDLQPNAVGFCPEDVPCINSCDVKFGADRTGAKWGDCRDICVALYIRVDCGHGEPPPGGAGGSDDATKVGGGGGNVAPSSGMRDSSVTARQAGATTGPAGSSPVDLNSAGEHNPDPAQAHLESSLLRSFSGKEKLGNRKAKDPLHSDNELEKTVEEAISSSVALGKSGDTGELTLFERVHRKYGERLNSLTL